MSKAGFKNLIVFILLFFLVACREEPVKDPMDQVTVQLVWKHQAQFAGFYAAALNGFYEEENIEITLRPRSSPSFDVTNSVVRGDADFGVDYGIGILESRGKNLPVIAIAAIYQRYPLSFISLQERAITHPIDFIGQRFPTLTPSGVSVLFDVLLKKHNIDRRDISFVQTGYNFNRLFSGEVDVWPGYTINEVLIARDKGVNINQVKPEDFEVNVMGDTLFTSNILLNTNPDLVLRFVRATLRGWQWAVEHPKAAGRMALHFDSTLSPAHQEEMMTASIPYIQATGSIGKMDDKVWQEVHDILLNQEIIKKPINSTSAYTNTFVETYYRDK